MVCLETLTVCVVGPLSFVATYAFVKQAPCRYVTQLIISVCHLYGDSLYYMTAIMEGFKHGEMYHPLHFWFYFVFMNSLWIIIPFMCIIQSCWKLVSAQEDLDKALVQSQRETTKYKRK